MPVQFPEKFRTVFIKAINDVEVKSVDILNTYALEHVTEKVRTLLGPKCDSGSGKITVIFSALYGLKSAGAAFNSHLVSCMESMGYFPCWAEPDLWMRPETYPENRVQCYLHLLCYVDEILCIHFAESVLQHLHQSFVIKAEQTKCVSWH